MAQPQPEFEIAADGLQTVRYLEHGFPSELVRWHCHNSYELHYIVDSFGKVFVGDYIGDFAAGHTLLTGPRLPHNWISHTEPGETIALRDRVVQFGETLLPDMSRLLPELESLLPLLDRARFGVEFLGEAQRQAGDIMRCIGDSRGPKRIALLIDFLQLLADETQYRLLSTVSMGADADDDVLDKVNRIANFILDNYQKPISQAAAADLIGMNESAFSRFFKKATGNGFNKFLNRVRVSKACELLAHSNTPITAICFEAGFNNVANFNRQFLRIKSTTPREYRAQSQQHLK